MSIEVLVYVCSRSAGLMCVTYVRFCVLYTGHMWVLLINRSVSVSVCVPKGGVRTKMRKDWGDGVCGYVCAGSCRNI